MLTLLRQIRFYVWANDSLVHLAAAAGAGILLGALALLASPLLVLGGLTGLLALVVMLRRPELGLLCILLFTASIVDESALPLIPIGIGSLHIVDIVLLALLAAILVRGLVDPGFKLVHTPLDLPLALFFGMSAVSSLAAILNGAVDFNEALREVRVVAYFLTFFIVTNLVREKHQIAIFLMGLLALSGVVAALMAAQSLLGASFIILPDRVETLWTQGEFFSGITRVLPPGQSIIVVAFIMLSTYLTLMKHRPRSTVTFFLWGLTGFGIILTFTRSFWIQAGLAAAALAFLARGKNRQRLLRWGSGFLLVAVMTLAAIQSTPDSEAAQLTNAFTDRLLTLGESDTVQEDSLQWRYVENEYALPQLFAYPVIGKGLGTQYRPWDSRIDYYERIWWDARGYIHNAHFWIMIKSGLLAYFGLVWFSAAMLVRGFRYWQRITDVRLRAAILGFTLVYLGIPIGAIVNPVYTQWYWTPVLGMMAGVNESIIRLHLRETEAHT